MYINFLIKKMVQCGIYFCIFVTHHSFAMPLLAINQTLWNEKTKIVIANCAKPAAHVVKSHYLSKTTTDKTFNYLAMEIVNENNAQYVYAVSSEQDQTISILYRFAINANDNTNANAEVMGSSHPTVIYQLPFGAASASLHYCDLNRNKSVIKTSALNVTHNLPENEKYLLLTANESEKFAQLTKSQFGRRRVYATVFDLKQQVDEKPKIKFIDGIQNKMTALSDARIVQHPERGKIIILAGVDGTENMPVSGALQMIFMDSIHSPLMFRTAAKHRISQLTVLDQSQNNTADTLYCWDIGGGLWRIDLKNVLRSSIEKIYETEHFIAAIENKQRIKAIRSLRQPGITFYLTGNGLQQTGSKTVTSSNLPGNALQQTGSKTVTISNIFRLEVPNEGKPEFTSIVYENEEGNKDKQGNFSAIFARFGRLILVPHYFADANENAAADAASDAGANPDGADGDAIFAKAKAKDLPPMLVLDLMSTGPPASTFGGVSKSEKYFKVKWQHLLSESGDRECRMQKPDALAQSYLLWDNKTQQEVLVSLNQNCNLYIFSAPASQDKYGRISWQKKKKN